MIAPSQLIIAPGLVNSDESDDTVPVRTGRGELDDSWFEVLPWDAPEPARTGDGTEIIDATVSPQRSADRRKRLFAGALVGVATVAFAVGAAVSARSGRVGTSAAGAKDEVAAVAEAAQPAAPVTAGPTVSALPLAAPALSPPVTPAEPAVSPVVDPETLAALDPSGPPEPVTPDAEAAPDAEPTLYDAPAPADEVVATEPEPAVAEQKAVPGRATARKTKKSSRSAKQTRKTAARKSKVVPGPRVASREGRGTLMIGAKPPCRIYVDGRFLGTTPQRSLVLPAGSHKVVLRNKEHRIRKQLSVTIQAGKNTKVIRDYLSR